MLDMFLDYVETYLSKVTHTNRISNITEKITNKCKNLLPVYSNCKYIVNIFTNVDDIFLSVRIYAVSINTNGAYIQPDTLPYLDFKYGNKLTDDNKLLFKKWFDINRCYDIEQRKHNISIDNIDLNNILEIGNIGYTTIILRDNISSNIYTDIRLTYCHVLKMYIVSMYRKNVVNECIENELITWNGEIATINIINNILTSYSNPIILLYNQSSILEYKR